MNGRIGVETFGSVRDIIVMSCLSPLSADAEEIESPPERGIGATWLAELPDPFLLFCPTSSTTKGPLRPCRRVDPQIHSVQVHLELLTDNAAAGREAEEMLKTGCQCVLVSVSPGPVRNGPPSPTMLTRHVQVEERLHRPRHFWLISLSPWTEKKSLFRKVSYRNLSSIPVCGVKSFVQVLH